MARALNFKQIYNGIFPEIVFIGCSVISVGYYAKHAICLNYYKKYTTLNGNYGPIQPSDRLKSLYSAVEQDLKSLVSENTSTVPYIVPGLKVHHGGMVGTLQGGVIGLPLFFEFDNKNDVEGKIIKADSSEEPVEELYDCFLLSDNAKKYAIARGILCVNTLQVYIETVIPLGIGLYVKCVCNYVPNVLNIHSNPTGRGLFYALLLLSGLLIWRNIHSIIKNYFEDDIEETLATLGIEYIEGAVEFYSKTRERKQLRLDWKDENTRLLKTISDKIDSIASRKDVPVNYKLAFYKNRLKAHSNEDMKEEKVVVLDK